MRWVFVILVCLLGSVALAATPPVLAEPALKRIRASPERFVEAAAVLIHGYGSDGAVDAAAVDRFIALQRAGARASALRKLLAADLDADGAIAADEVAAAEAATGRGRLIALHGRADGDGDGTVSAVELTLHTAIEALAGFTEAEAQAARAVLACDQDGDGHVTLPEVRAAVAALDKAA